MYQVNLMDIPSYCNGSMVYLIFDFQMYPCSLVSHYHPFFGIRATGIHFWQTFLEITIYENEIQVITIFSFPHVKIWLIFSHIRSLPI